MGILRIFSEMLKAMLAGRAALVSENLALRHQLGVLQRSVRSRLTPFSSALLQADEVFGMDRILLHMEHIPP